jgi:4a-hydroxytetrahydrobiopterin dehydratase
MMRISKLTTEQMAVYMNKLPNWKFENNTLTKEYRREDFKDSIAFVLDIAELANKLNHHPDLNIRYDRVSVILTTHDKNGVTGKDFLLAQQIEALKIK